MARRERSSRRSRGSSSKSRSVKIDWKDVDLEGGGFKIPEGEYLMEVESVEKGVSKNDNEQLEWVFKGTEGKAKGKTFKYYTTLTPESLWKLGGLLTHLGQEVPEDEDDLDLDELVGLTCMGVVQDSEWEGKTSSKLVDTFEEGGESNGKDNGKSDRKSGKKDKKGPKKISADEVRDMDEGELEDLVKEYELDVDLDEQKNLRRKAAAVINALEEGELLEKND